MSASKELLLFVFLFINGNQGQSPCPGIFDYQKDRDITYGLIRFKPNISLTHFIVRACFTIDAQWDSENKGRIELLGISGLNRTIAPEEVISLRIHFPIQNPLPRLDRLTFNNETICHRPERSFFKHSVTEKPGSGHSMTMFSIEFNSALHAKPTSTFTIANHQRNVHHTPPLRTNSSIYPLSKRIGSSFYGNNLTSLSRTSENSTYECGFPKVSPSIMTENDEYLRGELPWLVAIFKQEARAFSLICSGSLVSNRHVVTAAHCLHLRDQKIKLNTLVVMVDAFDLDDFGDADAKRFYVDNSTPHIDYDSFSLKNDILVLVLKGRVIFNDYIIPVCLWTDESTDLNAIVGKNGLVAGWSQTERYVAGHGRPHKANIPVVSTEECRKSHPDFNKITSEYTICAGYRNGTNPCNGDSGSGMYFRQPAQPWTLRGVVSVSILNNDDESLYECNKQQYVVFTDAAKYIPWIRSIIEEV